jgi:hypothetical protein
VFFSYSKGPAFVGSFFISFNRKENCSLNFDFLFLGLFPGFSKRGNDIGENQKVQGQLKNGLTKGAERNQAVGAKRPSAAIFPSKPLRFRKPRKSKPHRFFFRKTEMERGSASFRQFSGLWPGVSNLETNQSKPQLLLSLLQTSPSQPLCCTFLKK